MQPKLFNPADPPAQTPLLVRDIVQLYLRHSQVEGVHCPEAFEERQRTLGWFVADLGDLPVADCRPFHLVDWIEAHPRWRSVSTRRAKANEIRAAFQWAADGERTDRNPFSKVRYAEAERRPELPDDALEQVAHLANKQFESVLIFLRLTGCRLSELCGALWSDMNLEAGVWTIPKHKSRKHTGKSKRVALVPDAVALLRAIGEHAGPIFVNTRGRPWNRRTLGQQLRRLKARHGITTPATLHGIRHRLASAAIAAGAPIKLIAAQLGHSSCAVTERYYTHLEGEMDAIRDAARLGAPKKRAPGCQAPCPDD